MGTVLVLGAQGMLGSAVAAELRSAGHDVRAPARADFDASVETPAPLLSGEPGAVVNAIGVVKSRIDADDPDSVDGAFEVNGRFPQRLARAARRPWLARHPPNHRRCVRRHRRTLRRARTPRRHRPVRPEQEPGRGRGAARRQPALLDRRPRAAARSLAARLDAQPAAGRPARRLRQPALERRDHAAPRAPDAGGPRAGPGSPTRCTSSPATTSPRRELLQAIASAYGRNDVRDHSRRCPRPRPTCASPPSTPRPTPRCGRRRDIRSRPPSQRCSGSWPLSCPAAAWPTTTS